MHLDSNIGVDDYKGASPPLVVSGHASRLFPLSHCIAAGEGRCVGIAQGGRACRAT